MKIINNYVARFAFLSLLFISVLGVSVSSSFAMGRDTKTGKNSVATVKSRMTAKTTKPRKHRKHRAVKKLREAEEPRTTKPSK